MSTIETDLSTFEATLAMLGTLDPTGLYTLRVKGDNLVSMLMCDGDLVVIRKADKVDDGKPALIYWRTAERTSIREVHQTRDGKLLLRTTLNVAAPFAVDPSEIEIRGKVISVIRHMEVIP